MSKYDDIINRKYEGSVTRKRMSPENRAAQFAPFAALIGHDAAISETARLTSEQIELSGEEQKRLSERLNIALENIANSPTLTFTVFESDTLKSGGKYVRISGVIKKYDDYERVVILTTNQTISIDDIISIDGKIFNDLEL